jgi:uncharacterized protein YbaA (DUF1428 family)
MIVEVTERTFVDDKDGRMVTLKECKDLEGKVTKTAYIGVGPFQLPNGQVVPMQFGIEAQTIEEAMDKYPDGHKEAVKQQIAEMNKPRLMVPQGSMPSQNKKIITGDFKK